MSELRNKTVNERNVYALVTQSSADCGKVSCRVVSVNLGQSLRLYHARKKFINSVARNSILDPIFQASSAECTLPHKRVFTMISMCQLNARETRII